MSERVGRERFRRDHFSSSSSSSLRSEENKFSRGKNPPSRHLWVGNLSHHIAQSTLTDHFIRFGELENIAYNPGRSYAFVNFVREEDAMVALKSLQGFSLAGMPLRIEFAKSDKSSAPPRDEIYLQHRDELQPSNRGSAFSQMEPRKDHGGSKAFSPDSSRTRDHSTDVPSKILWIGFPSFLKVDESILRKAFSPFGEIDKITAFSGRTFAFVQFRNLASACRAKEILHGKLFGNPRVHIRFARSDTVPSTGGKRGMGPNAPPSPHPKPDGRAGSSDNFWPDKNFGSTYEDPSIRPHQFPNMEYVDDTMSFSRKEPLWTHTNGAYEERRSYDLGPDVGLPPGQQGYYSSPGRDGSAHFHEFYPQKFPRKSTFPEDSLDLPEDAYTYHGAKKLKTNSFPRDNELPEYPFHNAEQGKHAFQRIAPDLHRDEAGSLPYRRLPDDSLNLKRPLENRLDSWGAPYDTFQSPPPNLSSMPVEWKRASPELHQPGLKREWKWEGTIAKGGTPVCRARCFPVGKVMDIFLPEFLDCTARTGLDMLAKHYYQAAASWVVFFVPASDADMGYYNEFMHYLGEKQRAAVAKLDERNTLFLVPPSDFSENVLKVPGKLSISGVVLSLEPASPGMASLPPANNANDRNLLYSHVDTSYHKPELPSVPFPLSTSHANSGKPGISTFLQGNMTTSTPSSFQSDVHGSTSISYVENRHEFQPGQRASTLGPTWSSHQPETSVPTSRNSAPEAFPLSEEFHNSIPSSLGSLRPEQHAELPSALGGPQKQSANSYLSAGEGFRSSGVIGNQPENLSRVPPTYNALQTNQVPSDLSTSPFSQLQQPQPQPENMQGLSHAGAIASHGSQEVLNVGGTQNEGEADPQKRLQATLQLAAALLQQIQQGKGT